MRIRLGIDSSVAITSTRRSELLVELGRRGDVGVDRDQIVLAGELHAVTGVIDHRDRVGAAGGDLVGEVLHDPDHVVLRQVGRRDHLEAGRVQELRHRLRVIVGIGELAAFL